MIEGEGVYMSGGFDFGGCGLFMVTDWKADLFTVHQVRETVERVTAWWDTWSVRYKSRWSLGTGLFLHGDGETGIGRHFDDSQALIQGKAFDETLFCGGKN